MFNWYLFELMVVMVVILLGMVGFVVFLLVKLFESCLFSLEKVVLCICGGDLNVKVSVEGLDVIG